MNQKERLLEEVTKIIRLLPDRMNEEKSIALKQIKEILEKIGVIQKICAEIQSNLIELIKKMNLSIDEQSIVMHRIATLCNSL